MVIADYYRLYCLYLPKWSYLMGYLKERSEKMYTFCKNFLLSNEPNEKLIWLRRIIREVIEPLGGFPPKEWKVVIGQEEVYEKDNDQWKNFELPELEKIQPFKDAYLIGLNQETREGQELSLPLEYECYPQEYFYWENGIEFPYHNEAIKKVVQELSKDKGVHGIIVFGSHGLGWARPDSDVDIYIVREDRTKIFERKFVNGVEFGLEFVNFTDVYQGILYRRNTSYWRNFKESQVLFARHPDVWFMREIATLLFEIGLTPLSPDYQILIRKKLQHVLEDGDELLKRGDIVSLLYNDNFLFCLTIQKWFRMNNWLDTKRTYIMKEIQEKDEVMYRKVSEYLKEREVGRKHRKLRELVEYVIEPFGGYLPEEWSIPVVDSVVSDSEIDEFLRAEGVNELVEMR